MKRAAFLGFLALIIVLVASLMWVQHAERPSAVNFFFTADTQGFLVPCGCKTVPAGGLARRASALSELRSIAGRELVVPVEVTHGFADRGPARERLNREMGSFYARTGTLVGLGGYDLLLGPEALRMAAPGVPLFLAGREPHAGSKGFSLGGWGVGPFGKKGGRLGLVFLAESVPGGPPLMDPLVLAGKEMASNPADRYILTGQFSPKVASGIMKDHPQVLCVVAQWQTTVTTVPQRTPGGQWLMYMGDRGRRSATVRVAWSAGRWEVMPMVQYLGPEISSDPAIEAEVAGVLREVEGDNGAALARMSSPRKPGEGFVGSARCATCHAEAEKRWLLSPHAKATADLAIDHQRENPDCLVCHATGLGNPGGYPNADVDLTGVQCEACHGPGEGHPPKKLHARPACDEDCGPCHTPRDSPMFDAGGFWQMVKHS